MSDSGKYDAAAVRSVLAATALIGAIFTLSACGSEGVQVASSDPDFAGAQLFAQRCSGCHSLDAAGAQGSANRVLRNQGPNLNQRIENYDDVLYAIRNGGFSGAIMPQQIVTGEDAKKVAKFVSDNAGDEVNRRPIPGQTDPNTPSETAKP
jgi:mono/diheme cytochrome c family protein